MVETKTLIICVAVSSILSALGTAIMLPASPSGGKTEHSSQAIEQRINALESRLEELAYTPINEVPTETVANSSQLPEATEGLPQEPTPGVQTAETNRDSFEELRRQRREQLLAQQQPDYRTRQFIDAGFAQEEAARIIQLEENESLRQLDEQYQSRRQQLEGQDVSLTSHNLLRAELGVENYERYLEANNQPTSAAIGTVIDGSPGAIAGLQAGDRIVSYAGDRVFSLNEVNLLTAQGQVGQNVLIEVERGSEQVQLSIPRGPIGVTSGRRRFRR